VARCLLKANADPALADVDGVLPLHFAIHFKHDAVAKVLAKAMRKAGVAATDHLHDPRGEIVLPDKIKQRLQQRFCARCKRSRNDDERSFKKRARCQEVRYCSQECQTVHWKEGHQQVCRAVGDQQDDRKHSISAHKEARS
jgi:hypothetical protein